jgi:hypothetical protein
MEKERIGYIFLCSDATEHECLEKKLLGGRIGYFNQVKNLQAGDTVYLYNFNSKRLFGPFLTTSGVKENIDQLAWGGDYPVQVRYKITKKYLPLHRESLVGLLKFNKIGFPIAKVSGEQMAKLLEHFQSEVRHKEYDDSANLITTDGHNVRSEGERKIDNWLFEHGILHAYEYPIPGTKRCDFFIPMKGSSGIYIEFWGLQNKVYLANKKLKQEIYRKNKLQLIEVEQKDLKNLNKIFRPLL